MSQMGPSSDAGVPSITAASVRIAFVPDMESLDQALQQAERRATETVDRIKAAGKEAIAGMLADAMAAFDAIETRKAQVQSKKDSEPAHHEESPANRVAPVADQTLTKLTEIARDVAKIAENTEPTAPTQP